MDGGRTRNAPLARRLDEYFLPGLAYLRRMTPQRIVIRPRVQIALLVAIFVMFALIGLTFFTNGNVVGGRDWFGIILGGTCLIGGLLGAWRTLRMGVFIDARGIHIRGVDSRDRHLLWTEVDSIACEPVGNRAGIPLYAPVVRLGGQGGEIAVRSLASYSRADAERKTERIHEFSGNSVGTTASAPAAYTPVTVEMVRQAASYPRMVLAARLYAGGLVWACVPTLVVAYSGLGPWWLLLPVPGIAMIVVGVVLARRTFRTLEREVAPGNTNQITSAAVIASARDLVRGH